ncbi:MAG: recombinase family protein [Hyphomonas sp.]|uniref:recombinase family protein n=1 Tax=Hyphomonas sp. TaxID=87 RepID=UPI001D452486|nr:recombinase family protein [Hyphomonas sp.]MBA4228399.1 recombinase family protein [Hyphomonas sp.]
MTAAGSGRRIVRCAIYTRKSSEEGLDQAFNSLDAQREACEAYVSSQRHEGWKLIPAHYDDGGLSGGTLERPALTRLLEDIDAGKIDLVVVYKIDRLTRSLADFAKLVDRFDAAGCSFVSVTQAFNTSTSMGRLTLNVLLSFAQFEREVTAERIRDKISASKKKGYWMGGLPPLGYEPHPDPQTRSLVINAPEAEIVRELFQLYDTIGCVRLVEAEAARRGYRTKSRTFSNDRKVGGKPLRRGHIHFLLRNPIYVGRIRHKREVHDGLHEPLIDEALWDRVQAKLGAQDKPGRRSASGSRPFLTGKLIDETGDRLTPSHASKGPRRYRYYVSSRLLDGRGKRAGGWRLPAKQLETQLAQAVSEYLITAGPQIFQSPTATLIEQSMPQLASISNLESLELIAQCKISEGQVELEIAAKPLAEKLRVKDTELAAPLLSFTSPFQIKRRGIEARLIIGGVARRTDETLIRAIALAHAWATELRAGTSMTTLAERRSCTLAFIRQRLPLAFLSPKVIEAILAGRQPHDLTLTKLITHPIPLDWDDQWAELGFSASA